MATRLRWTIVTYKSDATVDRAHGIFLNPFNAERKKSVLAKRLGLPLSYLVVCPLEDV